MWLGSRFMNGFMLFAIPAVGLFVTFKRCDCAQSRALNRRDLILCLFIGLAVGFYDGFFGPGTGTFLMILFTYITGMDLVTASATAKPVNLASNLSSLVTRICSGDVLFALAIPAMCFSVAGGWLGSKMALMKGARFVRYVMLGVLALLTLKLALEFIT